MEKLKEAKKEAPSWSVRTETTHQHRKSPMKRKRSTPDELDIANKPVRPLSAYNYFFREERVRLLEERKRDVTLTGREPSGSLFQIMGKTIGQRWKALSSAKRSKYDRLAAADSQRYHSEMMEFNARITKTGTDGVARVEAPLAPPPPRRDMVTTSSASSGGIDNSDALSLGGRRRSLMHQSRSDQSHPALAYRLSEPSVGERNSSITGSSFSIDSLLRNQLHGVQQLHEVQGQAQVEASLGQSGIEALIDRITAAEYRQLLESELQRTMSNEALLALASSLNNPSTTAAHSPLQEGAELLRRHHLAQHDAALQVQQSVVPRYMHSTLESQPLYQQQIDTLGSTLRLPSLPEQPSFSDPAFSPQGPLWGSTADDRAEERATHPHRTLAVLPGLSRAVPLRQSLQNRIPELQGQDTQLLDTQLLEAYLGLLSQQGNGREQNEG